MKTAKFLTVLATASMFVACVEDLAPVENENFQQEMEVVGGKVIGTDVTMDIPMTGVQTKYAGGEARWDKEDKIGMGWLAQGADALGTDKTLYANHMFYVNAEGTKFEARGNIYEGWHFAYYPYQYMAKPGELELNLNPAQTVKLYNAEGKVDVANLSKRYAQRFHVSALQKLTQESLVAPDYNEISEEVRFDMAIPVAQIMFRIRPVAGSAFAEKDNLKGYKIEEIRFSTGGANYFATSATLDPTKLHQYVYAAETDNFAELHASFEDAFVTTYDKAISLNVKEAGYTVGEVSPVLAYTLPYRGSQKMSTSTHLEPKKAYFSVKTNMGSFKIYYEKDAEEGSWQAANNAAFLAMKAAFETEEGTMRHSAQANNEQLLVDFYLHDECFDLNWDVANAEDWANKVQLADDLELETPVFNLVNANININEVTIPEGGVTLTGKGDLNVTEDWTWNEKVEFAEGSEVAVKVAAAKTLTVTGELAPKSLVNNGTIDAQFDNEAKIGAVLANLTNNGEVKVTYGAQVYPVNAESCGIISYVVPENYTRSMIEKVTAVGFEPKTNPVQNFANVNTLIINGFVVDFHSSTTIPGTEGVEDPYLSTPGTGSSTNANQPFGTKLSTINFVLNNATIKSTESVTTVKNVTMTNSNVANLAIAALAIEGGENTVDATVISNGVTVKDGKNLVEATTITGDVTVEAGEGAITAETINGNVTINGNYTIEATTITGGISVKGDSIVVKAGEIFGSVDVNTAECTVEAAMINGSFSSKAGFNTVTVENGIIGGVNIKDGKGLISARTIENGITIEDGNYTIKAEKVAGDINVTGENYLTDVAVINGNVTINHTAKTAGCALNGNKIDGNLTLTGNGFGLDNVTVADVTLKEGNVKVNNTTVKNFNIEKGNASLTDCTIAETLTNSGTVVVNGKTTMKNIVNNGSFTSYVELVVNNVTLNPSSVTTLTSNGKNYDLTIWYTGTYENKDMTLNGAVTKYGYYAEQLKAAIADPTVSYIKLQGEVQLTEVLNVNRNVTIDLNGQKISTTESWSDADGSNSYIFEVTNGTLTIMGDGYVETAPSNYGMCVWANGGNVVINGGNFYSPGINNQCCDCIYANIGHITINGGKFVQGGELTYENGEYRGGAVLAVSNGKDVATTSITVNGGTFEGALIYEEWDKTNIIWNIK